MDVRDALAQLALASRPHRDHVDEGGLAGVLQPDQGQLHLLLPEERLEPVQQFVDQRDHLGRPTVLPQRLDGYAS